MPETMPAILPQGRWIRPIQLPNGRWGASICFRLSEGVYTPAFFIDADDIDSIVETLIDAKNDSLARNGQTN